MAPTGISRAMPMPRTIHSLWTAAAGFCLGLAACVPFQPGGLSPEQSAAGFSRRSLSEPGLQAYLKAQGAGGAGWNLDRLAVAATYFNGEVALARAKADEALARIAAARQSPNPVFSFAPGYNSSSKGISPWILAPSFEIPVETAGKKAARVGQAQAEAEAARCRVAQAGWEVRGQVRAAMLDLHAADVRATWSRQEIDLREQALAKLDLAVKEGESPAYELTQERVSLNRARLAADDAEKDCATAQARLAAAVGVPVRALDGVRLDFSDFARMPADPGSAARRRALLHRGDLLACLADYAAADAALKSEVAKQYPDIHLGPGYELDQTDNKWTLGVSVELPLVNRNRGGIATAEATRRTAAAAFDARQAAVFGEIETALADCSGARAKVRTAGRIAADARQAAATTENMVQAGELAPVETIRRRIEAATAGLEHANAVIEAQQAAGRLEAAVQVPLRSLP